MSTIVFNECQGFSVISDKFDVTPNLKPGLGHRKRSGYLNDGSSSRSYTMVEPPAVYFSIRSTTWERKGQVKYIKLHSLQVCHFPCIAKQTNRRRTRVIRKMRCFLSVLEHMSPSLIFPVVPACSYSWCSKFSSASFWFKKEALMIDHSYS